MVVPYKYRCTHLMYTFDAELSRYAELVQAHRKVTVAPLIATPFQGLFSQDFAQEEANA